MGRLSLAQTFDERGETIKTARKAKPIEHPHENIGDEDYMKQAEGKRIRVLYAGDGEFVVRTVAKGLGYYITGSFVEESLYLRRALESDPGIKVDHLHTHLAIADFPRTARELVDSYEVVILSDIPSDSLIFYPDMLQVPMGPNRLKSIQDFVAEGGGFLMCGGWSSFGGHQGGARYHNTPVEEILPVVIHEGDDRVEVPEGFRFNVENTSHAIMAGIPWKTADFILMGYNKVTPKPQATVLASFQGDPMICVGEYHSGRAMAFAPDCAPHWAGTFINWEHYPRFWIQSIRWLAKRVKSNGN